MCVCVCVYKYYVYIYIHKITGGKSDTTRTLIGYWTKGACLYNSIMAMLT